MIGPNLEGSGTTTIFKFGVYQYFELTILDLQVGEGVEEVYNFRIRGHTTNNLHPGNPTLIQNSHLRSTHPNHGTVLLCVFPEKEVVYSYIVLPLGDVWSFSRE